MHNRGIGAAAEQIFQDDISCIYGKYIEQNQFILSELSFNMQIFKLLIQKKEKENRSYLKKSFNKFSY